MKRKLLLVFFLSLTAPVFAQVTFSPVNVGFPHIVIGGDPAGFNYATVLQVVNNNSISTTARLQLFADDGTPLLSLFDGVGPQSSLNLTLDSGAAKQIQITSNGAITGGWLQITYKPADAQTTLLIRLQSGNTLLTEVGVNP